MIQRILLRSHNRKCVEYENLGVCMTLVSSTDVERVEGHDGIYVQMVRADGVMKL